MGILDVIKRWFGGGKSAPVKTSPPTRTSIAAPTATSPKPAPPAPLSAAEALDVIAANRAAAKPSSQVDRREKPRVNARDGTRVLVIDDSPTIVALLKRMLEQNGYRTSEAIDAETGVVMATSDPPDLIFLDIVLPGMNGFEALRRLRRDPATKIVPIVMISGNELATEQFYAQRIGADDFMKKPFSRSEVFARIEKLLDAEKVPRRLVKAAPAVEGASAAASAVPVAPSPAVEAGAPVSAVAEAPAAPVQTSSTPPVAEPVAPVPVAMPAVAPAVASAPEAIPASVAPPAPESAPTPAEPEASIAVEAAETAAAVAAAPAVAVETPAAATPASETSAKSPIQPSTAESETALAGEIQVDAAIAAEGADAAAEAPAPPAQAAAEDDAAQTDAAQAAGNEQSSNGAGDASETPLEAAVEAVADTTTFRAPDAAQTLIIEETLRAPANDAQDAAPHPLAAVASRVSTSMASDGAGAPSVTIAVGPSPVSSASTSHIISS